MTPSGIASGTRLAVFIGALFAPLGASAQDVDGRELLDAADTALEEARFAEAVTLYDRAERATSGLDRADLVRLLRDRALARAALRDSAGATEDLAALVALEPQVDFGDEAAPSFRALLDEARATSAGPLRVEVETTSTDDGFDVDTRVHAAPPGLVRAIRVHDLSTPSAPPRTGAHVHVEAGEELRYAVELVGGGGAILLREGSLGAPRVARRALAPTSSGSADVGLIAGISAAVGAAVVAAVVALVLALAPSGRTQPSAPIESTGP